MHIDLSFNTSFQTSVFKLVLEFYGKPANQQQEMRFSTQTAFFYAPEQTAAGPVTGAGKINNIVLHNNIKLRLDCPEADSWALSALDASTNAIQMLKTVPTRLYNLKLDSVALLGAGSYIDLSGFKITATSIASNVEKPRAFFAFSQAARLINTTNVVAGDAEASFTSSVNYNFINLRKFVGFITIEYYTIKNGDRTTTPNKLNILVLPRPQLVVDAVNPGAPVTPNGSTWINFSLKAVELNGTNEMLLDTSVNIVNNNKIPAGFANTDSDFNGHLLTNRLPYWTRLTSSSDSVSVTDISCSNTTAQTAASASSVWTLSPISPFLVYGQIENRAIKFNGIPLTGAGVVVSANITASYRNFPNNSLVVVGKTSSRFELQILSTSTPADTVQNNVYANNFTANQTIGINNIDLAKYVVLDASANSTSYNLNQASNSLAIYLVVYNATKDPVGVVTDATPTPFNIGSPLAQLFMATRSRHVFVRTASGSLPAWSYLGQM